MRTLIISDIHSNLTALKAVLADAKPFGAVWCLGDVVGYGPDPNECIELIKDLPKLKCVKGNHDAAIIGDININAFNYEARASLMWLESALKQENRHWLEALDEKMIFDDITMVHGSPRNPVWEYIMDLSSARENLKAFNTQICLVGHTHIPCIYQMDKSTIQSTHLHLLEQDKPFSLKNKCILNPGSVGQPRDHDPRSAYMIYDDEGDTPWIFRRVDYDIEKVQKRILAAGLPYRHASRLSEGW
ncbi:MAG: metallophosphoesterase family protein [Anaerolineales bacterium]